MTGLGLAARWVHLTAALFLVGGAALVLLAGPSDRPTVQAWLRRVLAWSRALGVLAIASGCAALAGQVAVLEARPDAVLDLGALRRVALDTQGGRVWIARQGLLVLLLAFLFLRAELRSGADWLAARLEVALLAALAAGLIGLAGHAAAVEPDTTLAIANDATHVLAAGVWIGGLWPLALLLRRASRPGGADARPYAVLVARRFSRTALGAMIALVATGLVNAYLLVGDWAGLLGTRYGHLLLIKLAILVLVLVLARANRRVLPALAGEAESIGRPAMRRLARFVAVEGAVAVALLAVVAVMAATPPARHQASTWPLNFRLSTDALAVAPADRTRVLIGSQIAVLGAAAVLASLAWRRRAPLLAAASVLIAFGLGLALPPLAIDAYPLTYRRPSVPYTVTSIASGSQLYAEHCAVCHGPTGAGDGLAGLRLPRSPADLRGAHTQHHTAGDLYWWISEGIPAAGMPGFASRLSEEQRWDLVNFVRGLAAVGEAQRLGPRVEGDARLVAPDAAFAVGPTAPRALREYRGRKAVLLVLYSLPASRARLAELAELYQQLALLGVEVVAVPRDGGADAIRQLGGTPAVWFPVVTEGGPDIVRTYGRFSPAAAHAEFLIDRQGYLRAISGGDRAWPDAQRLLTAARQLNEERPVAPEPGEHVH